MPVKQKRQGGTSENKDHLSREMRKSRMALFIQQFKKEAQERLDELETTLNNMLATVDRAFEVELMKIPFSLQNTRIGDLIRGEEDPPSEVSTAMRREAIEMLRPPRRGKRATSTDDSPSQRVLIKRSSAKASKAQTASAIVRSSKRIRGMSAAGTLVGCQSAGNLIRTHSKVNKTTEPTTGIKPKLRSVVSAGDLSCVFAGSAPHVTITTAQGQAVCLSESNRDDIDLDLLDDVARCQIQKLAGLMMDLARKTSTSEM